MLGPQGCGACWPWGQGASSPGRPEWEGLGAWLKSAPTRWPLSRDQEGQWSPESPGNPLGTMAPPTLDAPMHLWVGDPGAVGAELPRARSKPPPSWLCLSVLNVFSLPSCSATPAGPMHAFLPPECFHRSWSLLAAQGKHFLFGVCPQFFWTHVSVAISKTFAKVSPPHRPHTRGDGEPALQVKPRSLKQSSGPEQWRSQLLTQRACRLRRAAGTSRAGCSWRERRPAGPPERGASGADLKEGRV